MLAITWWRHYDLDMKTVLLAGGLGTRMREETEYRPKPMVPIGSQPILWHIMKIYSSFNFQDFVVCTGYKSEMIRQYFRDYQIVNSDFTIKVGSANSLISHEALSETDWSVTIANTGIETMTGGRVFQARKYIGRETFMCTYGDGLANINLDKLLDFHKSHGKIATITCVQPPSRFGILNINPKSEVLNFVEKPRIHDWVNGGFFVFEPEIFDYLDQNSVLEQEPLMRLAEEGQLMAYKHEGFWQPMDTYRESQMLNQMWDSGEAPWKIW
jgi:glucose-1-phosphate cytidylyltransferase